MDDVALDAPPPHFTMAAPWRRPSWVGRVPIVAGVVGVVAVVTLAAATSSVRTELGVANVALGLAVATTVVALVSWSGGLATSVAAALALNWFHTEPVHTLRITESTDVASVALLGALGIGVSLVTAVRVRHAAVASRSLGAAVAADAVRDDLTVTRPVGEVWLGLVEAISDQLALVDCRVEHGVADDRPTIGRHRSMDDPDIDHRLVLPETGAVVPLGDPRSGRRVVLTPRAGIGAVEVDRRAVLAFVDQLAIVLDAGR